MRDDWSELCFPLLPGIDHRRDVQTLNELIYHLGMLALIERSEDGKAVLCIRFSDAGWREARSRKAGRRPMVEPQEATCGQVRSLRASLGAKEAASRIGMPLSTFYRKLKELRYSHDEEPFSSF